MENELRTSSLNPLMSFPFFGITSGLAGLIFSIMSPHPVMAGPAETSATILYDNNRFDPRLETAWGFSCLIKGFEKTILFDTDGDGYTLLNNMRLLEVKPAAIDILVLSHIHGDHTGGLGGFLEQNPHDIVYLPGSFPSDFKQSLMSVADGVEEVVGTRKICKGAYSTGELGEVIMEQALVQTTKEGLVIITGCAHPGIVHMVRKAKEITGEERVHLVMGGFHLRGELPSRIESIIDELDHLSVKKVALCHCSGDEARRLFKKKFGANYIESGVGKRIELPRLE